MFQLLAVKINLKNNRNNRMDPKQARNFIPNTQNNKRGREEVAWKNCKEKKRKKNKKKENSTSHEPKINLNYISDLKS